jgi:hypothetical protein
MDKCVQELARSILNPWDYSSCVPDGSHGTGKYSIKQATSIASGAAGTAIGFALSCGNNNAYSASSFPAAGAVQQYGANWLPADNNTAISALYGRTRLVSAGIRVGFTGNTINDSGVLLVAQMPAGMTLSNCNTSLSGLTSLAQYYKIIPFRQGAKLTWRPCDIDDQGAFVPPGASTLANDATTVPRPWLLIAVFGVVTAGASSMLVESCTNWEGQFQNPTFSPGGLSDHGSGPASVGWYEHVQNAIRTVAPIAAAVYAGLYPEGRSQGTTRLLTTGGPMVEEV